MTNTLAALTLSTGIWFLCVVIVAAEDKDVASGYIRGHRSLPGYDTFDFVDMNSAEAGFAAGVIAAVLLLCCLLCLCCGGGTRCSLWDCLALVCIWEICCDGRNPNDFMSM